MNNNNNSLQYNQNKPGYENPAYVSYFYGRLLREESEKILNHRGCHDGLFLLRELVQEIGSYALSICYQKDVHHYRIDRQEDDESTVKIDQGRNFIGPIELIKHHQREQDGLITKPKIPCERPKGTIPISYLFVNDSELNKLIDDEIKNSLDKIKSKMSNKEYQFKLNEARGGRFRYKYEKIVLANLHNSQPWFRANFDRKEANEVLTKAGLVNGKFLLRSSDNNNNLSSNNSSSNTSSSKSNNTSSSVSSSSTSLNDFYKISLVYNKEIKHYKIKYNLGKFSLEGGLKFDSIIQLVDYYHRCQDGLADILRVPLLLLPNRLDQIWLDSFSSKINNRPLNNNNITNNNNNNFKINNILNEKPDGIYDSNTMYDAFMNITNDNSNLLSQPVYVDDEPHNSADITDLTKVPETKRALFEDEENYEYESLSAYTVDLKDLATFDKLGSGCFGSVHRGTYKVRDKKGTVVQELPVAIKQLNIDNDEKNKEESREEIIKEAKIMKSLKHAHVIKFIGMCFDNHNGRLMIVLELAKLGPLHKYLRSHRDMSMIKIIRLCYQVALAMEYLSAENLVHRDLAARNVLLASEELAKISDFGMSRKMDETLYYTTQTQGKWPLKWYPPEAVTSGKFDEKSDVWSFGVTCWV